MASNTLSPELVCGHMLVQVDILEKAVNELDARQVKAAAEQDAKHIKAVAESEAKQSAAMQLVQSLLTQMTELRNELQEVRAHNQALAARLNAELELPRSASGASRPATLEELIQRRDALAKIKAAKMDCVMVKAAGYTCAEAKQAGYTCAEAKQGGYTCAEARSAGYIEGLKAAGYTCAEAKQVGYTCAEAKQGCYVEGLKAAGYTCAEAKQAGFNPRECMQAGFTFQEGRAAGFRSDSHHWNNGKPPPRIEPRLTLAARALRLRPPPPGEPGRGRRRAAARAARAPCVRPGRRRGEPALPTHARSCAWRPRVAAQGDMTGMGLNFVDGATCPRGTAPRCRDPKSRPLDYGRAGHLPRSICVMRDGGRLRP